MQMMQKPLPPSEPIPPGFGPATPPWVWKVTYGLIGVAVGAVIVGFAVVFGIERQKQFDKDRQCWDPPPHARAWAHPKVVADGTPRPLICARRADNNKGMFPYAHRCLRMVPCEDK